MSRPIWRPNPISCRGAGRHGAAVPDKPAGGGSLLVVRSRPQVRLRALGVRAGLLPCACGTVLHDHLAGMPMVQTTIFRSPRRIPEALLLCRTQDGVLVRGASMGRESRVVGLPECRRHPEWRRRSVHASPKGRLACAGTVVPKIRPRSASRAPWRGRRVARRLLEPDPKAYVA